MRLDVGPFRLGVLLGRGDRVDPAGGEADQQDGEQWRTTARMRVAGHLRPLFKTGAKRHVSTSRHGSATAGKAEGACCREFRDFIARGNVLDLAVAVIIGAAFATITTSLTEDIIMPVVGAISAGSISPANSSCWRGSRRLTRARSTDYAALKAAGVPVLGWGQFVTVADQLPDPRLHHLPDRPRGEQDEEEGRRTPAAAPDPEEVAAAARDPGRAEAG